jgi:hypothetical protein
MCSLGFSVFAQPDFMGIVKYKITVEGAKETQTDSMMLVFDRHQVKVTLYIPDLKNYWFVEERIFIDQFNQKKSYRLNPETNQFESDTLKSECIYQFTNTQRYGASQNRLGFVYQADPKTLGGQDIQKVECLGSLDHYYAGLKDYAFLGYQPIVVDGRLVLEYSITQSNGQRPRVYVSEIIPMDNVDRFFTINGYSKMK